MATKPKHRKSDKGIRETDIKKLIHLLDKIGQGIELLYYLLDNKRQDTFVVTLFSAEMDDLKAFITHEKRKTDALFTIDKSENLYALLCQGTSVDGGYYFMNRLIKSIQKKGAKDVYCSEIEVPNTDHSIQEIAFRLLNMYHRAKTKKADGEISFYTLR